MDESTDAEARALFQAGQVAFRDGRFENALEYFERAYELSHRPSMLYNMGQAADRLRRDVEAVDYFRRYLEAVPDADNRSEVESRIAVLERAAAEREAAAREAAASEASEASSQDSAPDTSARASAPAAPQGEGPGVGPWIVVGVAAAAVVGGGVLLGFALGDVASVENAADGSRWSEVQGAYDRSEPMSIVGVALIGVGVAGVIGGLAWGLSGGGGGDDARATLHVVPGGALLEGSF